MTTQKSFLKCSILTNIGKISPWKGWSGTGTAAQEGVESPCLGGFKSHVDVALVTWARGGLGSAGGVVGLHDLRGLFQPE